MIRTFGCGAVLAMAMAGAAWADTRELVEMPEHMQEHMMANMRDHLFALGEVLDALANGKVKEAGAIAETRIGMSSLEMHGASHMGPFMPEPMRRAGTELHRAASRLGNLAEEAELANTYEAQQMVFGALSEITDACNSCHAGYRIR